METTMLTVGYQGETIGTFIERLIEAKIDLLIDVRTYAWSRKRGFSKKSLQGALQEVNIEYVHLPELGMPRDLLKLRPALDDNTPILDAYEARLTQCELYISELLQIASGRRCCLMCMEADEKQCHRSRLARYLMDTHEGLHVGSDLSLAHI